MGAEVRLLSNRLVVMPVPMSNTHPDPIPPNACGAFVAVALAGMLLWLGVPAGVLVGLVVAAAFTCPAAGPHPRSEAARQEAADEQLQALRRANALAVVASAAAMREDPVTLLQILTREASQALGLPEAHVRIAPCPHFPRGLAISSLSPDGRPVGSEDDDPPARLLSSLISSDRWDEPLGLDAAGDTWCAFAISDMRGPIGVLAVKQLRHAAEDTPTARLPQEACALLTQMAGQAGLLLENSILFGDIVRRAWEVAGIAEVADATVGHVDLPRLLEIAVQRAVVITGAASGAVILADPRGREWQVATAYGVHRQQLMGTHGPLASGLPGEAILTGQTRIVDSPGTLAEGVPGGALPAGDGAALLVPIKRSRAADRPGGADGPASPPPTPSLPALGCLVCLSPRGETPFNDKDSRLLAILADEVAGAIEKARLHRRAIEDERLQRGLLELVADLHHETTASGVLARGCRGAAELIGVHAVLACQVTHGSGTLQVAHLFTDLGEGAELGDAAGMAPHPGCGGACLVAESLHGGIARSLGVSDGDWVCPLLRQLGARSVACMPLCADEHLSTAVLLVDREDPDRFDEETLQQAALVCSHVSGALETVLAFEAQRQEVEVSSALLSIAHLVATEADIGSILCTLNEVTLNILGSSTAVTLLWDGAVFAGAEARGGSTASKTGQQALRPIHGGDHLAEALRVRRDPLWLEDSRDTPLISPELAEHVGEGPLLICPMLSQHEELLGAMVLRPSSTERHFPPRDVVVARAVAHLGALAIDHARLQEQRVRAERMQALGELSAGIAHDVNNLLAGIMGHAQLALVSPEEPESVAAALQTISHACMDGAQMVQRIQSMTGRLHEGRPELVNLPDVLRQAVQTSRHLWPDRSRATGDAIEIALDLEPDVAVRGVGADLVEATSNLLANAVEAMPAGGRLALRCATQAPWAVVEISDTGVGMSEEVCRRVFDPFFTTKAQRGHGLGLSLTYGIVHRHLGTIAVESVPGQGSTFTIRLPLAAMGERAALQPILAPLPPLRVLMVDDEDLVAESLAGILRRTGHTVDVARSGRAALAQWQAASYDLVVTDHGMPGMTGVELAQKLREQGSAVPVLLITGWSTHEHAALDVPQAVDAVLQKPVSHEELVRAMQSIYHRAGDASIAASEAPARRRRAIVVDDHEAVVAVMQGALSSDGYEVEAFPDAQLALARFRECPPDVLITDLRLDGMAGTELARVVKSEAAGTPVILITGWRPDDEDLRGVDYCLEKPFNIQTLLDVVSHVLSHPCEMPG